MKRHHFLPATMLMLLAACSNKDNGIPPNYKVDETNSGIEWKGSAPTHFHKGTFKVTGNLATNGTDKVTGATSSSPSPASITSTCRAFQKNNCWAT